MIDLSELTVVIVTRNREKYLLRNLSRWKETNARIVVMDGSDKSSANVVNAIFPHVTYVYSPVSVEERLFSASKLITTKYTIMSGDDDLFLFSGILHCITELEQKFEYASAAGVALGFDYINQKVRTFDVYPNFIKYGQINHHGHWNRVRYHFSHYESTTIYAVVRSEVWMKTASILELQPTLSGNITELFVEFCNVYLGKALVINKLMWLRSHENKPQWGTFETVGLWLLSRHNENRNLLFNKIDINILSTLSKMPSTLRKLLFMKQILGKQLEYLTIQFNIKSVFKWTLLPFLFLFCNLKEKTRYKIIKFVSNSRQNIYKKSEKITLTVNDDIKNSFNNFSEKDQSEISSVTNFIENYNKSNFF